MADETEPGLEQSEKITLHFLKSNFFRTIHVDGAFGGVTPHGGINMQLFSERFPIPTSTTHEMSGHVFGPEIASERVSKDGIVRELEVGIMMDLATARAMRDWLDRKIEKLEAVTRGEEQ